MIKETTSASQTSKARAGAVDGVRGGSSSSPFPRRGEDTASRRRGAGVQHQQQQRPARNSGIGTSSAVGTERTLWPMRKNGPSPDTKRWFPGSVRTAAAAAVATTPKTDRLPTPTEQTPSPYHHPSGSNSGVALSSNGGDRLFASGFLTSGDNDDDHDDEDDDVIHHGDDGKDEEGGGGGGIGGELGEGQEEGRLRTKGEAGEDIDAADAFREEIEALSSSLRQDFELKLLATAKEGLMAACQRERWAGHLRLESHKCESSEEIARLQAEGRILRAEVAQLQAVNVAVVAKAGALGERLAELHSRTSSGSCVARCLLAWRREAARVRAERSKEIVAQQHARKKLVSRFLHGWREEVRQRIDSRGRKAADQKLHAISKEIVVRYEAELSSTRAALDDAINQIALEKARQREMEEGMRRTLLRGMSAMNMEAMRLMTEARDAGEEDFALSGTTAGTRYSGGAIDTSFVPAQQRLSEEWPRPLTPPRPAVPSSR